MKKTFSHQLCVVRPLARCLRRCLGSTATHSSRPCLMTEKQSTSQPLNTLVRNTRGWACRFVFSIHTQPPRTNERMNERTNTRTHTRAHTQPQTHTQPKTNERTHIQLPNSHTQPQTRTHTHTDTRKHKHFGFLCLTLLCRPKGLEAQVGAPLYRGRSHECIKT